ncbi:GNAT family N-acetyltransferase [Comamonas composti]|uniref:GNAT family N-acetyltransferase n=1 Tax=Comamonas composti TaxID=408558 RepID=UPI0003F60053|nr:GNAT family N-acetyltransferase [Comamonas composti]
MSSGDHHNSRGVPTLTGQVTTTAAAGALAHQGFVQPVVMRFHGVRLEPLTLAHEPGLRAAVQDGELWRIRVTSAPEPDQVRAYIQTALEQGARGQRFAFAVLDDATDQVLGTSSYHDILPEVRRVEIGYTWYAKSAQRSHVNTAAKLMLMGHAFDTLNCHVVGWRTDNFNFASQRAIERLGARKDGVIRGHAMRRDGTIRDTVMYSLRSGEWPESRAQLLSQLELHALDS